VRVQQRAIGGSAIAGRVYNNHKTNRHTPENIQSRKSLGRNRHKVMFCFPLGLDFNSQTKGLPDFLNI
jgi:hypothetical protein